MKKKVIAVIAVLIIVPAAVYFACPDTILNMTFKFQAKSANVTKKTIDADDFTIPYYEGGKGETVLLLHGLAMDKNNWLILAKFITPYFHVIIIDIPGYGESSKIKNKSYTIIAQAKRLKEIIGKLNLDKFHIAGSSMGGAIAGQYSIDNPDRILSLALIDALGVNSRIKSDYDKQLDETEESDAEVKTIDDFEKMINMAFHKPPPIPGRIMEHMFEQFQQKKEFNNIIFKDIKNENFLFKSELSKIKARTLILWGDNDHLLHVTCTEVFEKEIQNSKKIIIKDCGHLPMIEKPKETAAHYLKFLRNK